MSIISPTNNTTLIIDDFINYATAHLSTVSGVVNTISLYPPAATPGPGVVPWSGYQVDPATPGGGPTQNIEPVDTTPIEMTDTQVVAAENASLNGSNINEATAIAFDENSVSAPPSMTVEQSNELIINDANNTPTPSNITQEDLPKDNIERVPNYNSKVKVPDALVLAMRKYSIARTPLERAHFLAQCDHESGTFIYKEELASGTAYEGRKDLGNTQAGDGKLYKGRGYIQLTGRANYRKFGPVAGADFEGNPKSVATTYYADTACMFWKSNRLGSKCTDSSQTTIKVITKRINGGYNGLDDRIRKFTKYWTELQKDPTLWE